MTVLQENVTKWVITCFGDDSFKNKRIRALRFLEEAIELVQSVGLEHKDCEMLANQVFQKPIGNTFQEVGGTMTTLASLCSSLDIDMELAAITELKNMYERIDAIREKQKQKLF